jgi:hypothetical protein
MFKIVLLFSERALFVAMRNQDGKIVFPHHNGGKYGLYFTWQGAEVKYAYHRDKGYTKPGQGSFEGLIGFDDDPRLEICCQWLFEHVRGDLDHLISTTYRQDAIALETAILSVEVIFRPLYSSSLRKRILQQLELFHFQGQAGPAYCVMLVEQKEAKYRQKALVELKDDVVYLYAWSINSNVQIQEAIYPIPGIISDPRPLMIAEAAASIVNAGTHWLDEEEEIARLALENLSRAKQWLIALDRREPFPTFLVQVKGQMLRAAIDMEAIDRRSFDWVKNTQAGIEEAISKAGLHLNAPSDLVLSGWSFDHTAFSNWRNRAAGIYVDEDELDLAILRAAVVRRAKGPAWSIHAGGAGTESDIEPDANRVIASQDSSHQSPPTGLDHADVLAQGFYSMLLRLENQNFAIISKAMTDEGLDAELRDVFAREMRLFERHDGRVFPKIARKATEPTQYIIEGAWMWLPNYVALAKQRQEPNFSKNLFLGILTTIGKYYEEGVKREMMASAVQLRHGPISFLRPESFLVAIPEQKGGLPQLVLWNVGLPMASIERFTAAIHQNALAGGQYYWDARFLKSETARHASDDLATALKIRDWVLKQCKDMPDRLSWRCESALKGLLGKDKAPRNLEMESVRKIVKLCKLGRCRADLGLALNELP